MNVTLVCFGASPRTQLHVGSINGNHHLQGNT